MLVDKIASEYNGLSIREAVIFCKLFEYNITRQGLSQIGKKYGFIKIINKHNIINKERLLAHLKIVASPIPKDYVLLYSMHYLAKNDSYFYRIINKSNLNILRCGKEQRRYAKESDIRKLFENN
jgi:hypothetical protein